MNAIDALDRALESVHLPQTNARLMAHAKLKIKALEAERSILHKKVKNLEKQLQNFAREVSPLLRQASETIERLKKEMSKHKRPPMWPMSALSVNHPLRKKRGW